MIVPTAKNVANLLPVLMRHLRAHPQGLSEFELIKRLRDEGVTGFEGNALRTPLGLFRTHFILFHCLYRLRAVLAESGEDLQVHCLRIRLGRLAAGDAALAEPDPLVGYYLDLDNLERTDEAEVERLLGSFWKMFRRDDEREEALAVLGLQASASRTEIKQQYRRLAMRHHPDRGGDTEELQRLNAAMAVLEGP